MEKLPIHPEGPILSRLVAGAWRWNQVDAATVERLVHTCLEHGITSFDHADIYGDYSNEEIFGRVMKANPALRLETQHVSKCGIMLLSGKHPGTWIKHYDTTKNHIVTSAENSLSKLGVDFLDILLIHRPDPLMDPEEVAEAFSLLKQNGKVRYFGVSNFSATQFEMLQKYLPFPLVTNQIEVSLARTQPLFDGTMDVLMKHAAAPMAWSPLGGGKLLNQQGEVWSKMDKYSATQTQVALAWLLAHPGDIFPVIGTTQPERIAESAKSINIKLDRQDWFAMLKAVHGQDVP